jgi:hypothetical protein
MTTNQTVAVDIGYQDILGEGAWTENATGHDYLTINVEVDKVPPAEELAAAVFAAGNSSFAINGDTLTARVQKALLRTPLPASHHSFAVGDRVRVGKVELICAPVGWTRVKA